MISSKAIKAQSSKLKRFGIAVFFLSVLLAGCGQESDLEKARGLSGQSDIYYQQAVARYEDLIKSAKELDQVYFELGKLYYDRGEFQKAIEAFGHSGHKDAGKFKAISLYQTDDFTDALEVFSKLESPDDQCLYYYGLTSEKLNLFDQALERYGQIKDSEFKKKAAQRSDLIEKQSQQLYIKDLDPGISRIIENAPAAEDYPEAGALILSCNEKIEVTPQDTEVSELHYLIKILNERGKESFSETQIAYDSTFEKVEIEYARTIKPDGTVVDVGSRHIRDVSKYLNFPLYSNVRARIISFPEITEGSVIEYKLKVYNNQLINKKDFILGYPLQSNEPILAAEFRVVLPKEKALRIKKINSKFNQFGALLDPDIEEEGEARVYRWKFKDIPQIIPESNMPPVVEVNPAILLSTFDNWQDIYSWWWGLAKDKIKADVAIKKKVEELTSGVTFEEDKARAIYNFCAQKIRYVAVEYGQAGYEPHKAEVIFRNKYGDCKDQSILLVTMLKEAGVQSGPVLIATKEYYNLDKEFPSALFNHCIAAVFLKDKTVFMDPTAETCPFEDLPGGVQERRVLVFKEDGYEIQEIPLYPAEHNLAQQYLRVKINEDESLSAGKDNFTYGIYDQAQRYWLRYTQPELIKEALNEKIQGISIGAKLDEYKIENLDDLDKPVILSYLFHGSEYFTPAGPLRIMPQLAALDTSLVAKEKRTYDIDFGILDSKENLLEVELPEGFTVNYLPESITEDTPWFRFIVEYRYSDNKINFRQKTELKSNLVTAQDYPKFKELFEELAKKTKQRVVLERIR